jgi:hypothetical protein
MLQIAPKSRLIDGPIERAPLASVQQAADRIADMVARMERGEISIEDAEAAIAGTKAYVEARRTAELEAEVDELRGMVARLMQMVEQTGKP